jgi:hypothetical protein
MPLLSISAENLNSPADRMKIDPSSRIVTIGAIAGSSADLILLPQLFDHATPEFFC